MSTRAAISTTDALVAAVVIAAVAAGAVVVVKLDKTGQAGSGLGADYDFELVELGRIDPDRILYEPAGELDTGLSRTRAVAVGPAGGLYVAGDKVVRVFAQPPAPQPRRDLPLPAEPRALAVADDGTIVVATDRRVELLTPDGSPRASWTLPGPGAVATSVAVLGDSIYVADAGNGVVLRYGPDGKVVGRIGRRDKQRNVPGISGLSEHLDLAPGRDGLLRVANPGRLCVEAYTPDGDLERSFGKGGRDLAGFCGCCNPVNLAVAPDGAVVTAEKGYRRVKVYTTEGDLLGAVASPERFPDRKGVVPAGEGAGPTPVLDLAVDAKGTVWVLDTNSGVVRAFEPGPKRK